MNQEDVIRMAREAGLVLSCDMQDGYIRDGRYDKQLERFAALVATAEREACAEVCDEAHELMNSSFQGAAAAIRARGQE